VSIKNESSCNICGEKKFQQKMCENCGSESRHRLLYSTLEKYGYLNKKTTFENIRVLHISPDPGIVNNLFSIIGSGYYLSDYKSKYYENYSENLPIPFLRLKLPDDIRIFSDNYFDLIIHSSVLEHIPGKYVDHLTELVRILKPKGRMIFHVPLAKDFLSTKTIEGGEFLTSDEERILIHGENDHYKTFGYDFFIEIKKLNGNFCVETFTEEFKKSIEAFHVKITHLNQLTTIFTFTKNENTQESSN